MGRVSCWLDLTALKGSWPQVEGRGRKEQSILIVTNGEEADAQIRVVSLLTKNLIVPSSAITIGKRGIVQGPG